MHSLLITGACGFVGSNIADYFVDKKEVNLIGIDLSSKLKHHYDKLYSWNQLNEIDWDKIDTIIHLAGKAHDTSKNTNFELYFRINYELTELIHKYFIKSSSKKFIYFSSVKAVADSLENNILTEETVPNPLTPYGISKLQAEEYILSQSLDSSKVTIVLRPCMIHGPKNKGNLNSLFQFVKTGIPYPLGSFENQRSFTSIKNLLYIINLIISKNNFPSGVYNIADDETISTNTLIELISESLHQKKRIWKINKEIIGIIAKIGDSLKLPINSEVIKKLTESYIVSNQKVKTVLGISKLPIQAKDGFIETLKTLNI